jgi:hypothetical protein
MGKQSENVKTTVSIPSKNDNSFRRQAFNMDLTLGELFLKYQEAYDLLQGFEKGKNYCHQCGGKIKKFDDVKGILCQNCVK